MAELRAAQAARAAARKTGADRGGQEAAAVKGGVQQAQRQASVDASVKAANRPEVLNRQAPAGSALRAQQDRLAAQKAAQSAAAPRPTAAAAPRPTAAAPAPRPTAAAPAPRPTAAAPAPKVETKKKQPLQQSADLFDIIKGYLIDEGATEEEALKKMLSLTDEERTEIIEGSCGSKSKKKNSKKGGY